MDFESKDFNPKDFTSTLQPIFEMMPPGQIMGEIIAGIIVFCNKAEWMPNEVLEFLKETYLEALDIVDEIQEAENKLSSDDDLFVDDIINP
jgi:hypothetical protein